MHKMRGRSEENLYIENKMNNLVTVWLQKEKRY